MRSADARSSAGSECVYLWTPAGASVVRVPSPGFKAGALLWNALGTSFNLISVDGDTFCCAGPVAGL
jgi:hypothetical protein